MVFAMVTNLVLEWWASKLGIIKTIIGSELDAMINLMLDYCLRYKGSNVRVMLVGNYEIENTFVEVGKSRSMHVW